MAYESENRTWKSKRIDNTIATYGHPIIYKKGETALKSFADQNHSILSWHFQIRRFNGKNSCTC